MVRGAPAIDLGDALLHERIERLEAVRSLQADPERREDPEAVEGQGLPQSLEEALEGRLLQEVELLV